MTFRLAALVGALVLPFVAAGPVTNSIPTPGGFRPNANMTQIPVGGKILHVGENIHVLDAAGNVVHIKTPTRRPTKTTAIKPEETGWVAYTSWLNNGPAIGSFKTTWSVPPVPATEHGQTIFLFNSIEPGTFDAIMQPVLQYGGSAAGGGNYWAVATWYLYGDQTFFTVLVQVGVGQVLDGIVELVGASSGTSTTTRSSPTSEERVSLSTAAYAVTEASDYPSGSTVFSNTNLELSTGQFPDIAWSTSSDPADGLSTTVNVGGATAAVITITYYRGAYGPEYLEQIL
ncbi:hypothetical protein B0H13DRAFT_1914451 [Mycena leptocephala]|nr:hypothetical protein B0H13DRAFT_1914451 [Mycena leptocephala]